MTQIYDEPYFNDTVIRKTYKFFWEKHERDIGDLIDHICIWEGDSTIIKIKFTLWKMIRSGGVATVKGRRYSISPKRLKKAYSLLTNNEEEELKIRNKL